MKKTFFVIMVLLVMLIGTACGGAGDADEGSTGGNTVTIEASNWQFDKTEYTVPAGDVTVNLKNADGFHGITIEGTEISIEGDGKATANLKAGEYTIRCSVICGEGHAEMVAKLIVE
ncbi:cytochrome C oxidase subunit II [Bacillus litorisediminis]|uniref:cytochrome C oxidase subunit II n=1 Tax=Bacillus litorisediminis TaxID=2922713 RepID=UPI001FACA4C1|nr:cytochrome C oxidase subunit II [Bacillus litorisediminis]